MQKETSVVKQLDTKTNINKVMVPPNLTLKQIYIQNTKLHHKTHISSDLTNSVTRNRKPTDRRQPIPWIIIHWLTEGIFRSTNTIKIY